jgi:hypothetical protein
MGDMLVEVIWFATWKNEQYAKMLIARDPGYGAY